MTAFLRLPIATLLLLSAACATTPISSVDAGPVGQSLRVEAEGAPPIIVDFRTGGVVVAKVASQEAMGRWSAEASGICLEFPRQAKECWPLDTSVEPGRTVTLTSDRGTVAKVTRVA
jgi:hypothetical protein